MRLAAQMYTLRDFTGSVEELDEALEKVAEIGYAGVQLSAIKAWDVGLIGAGGIRELLDKHGLVCCATHRPLKRLFEKTQEEIEIHQSLGCDYVAVGSIAGEYGLETEGYRRFLSDIGPLLETCKSAGIRFGFHNHALEFMHQENSRRPRYDVLFEEQDLMLEIDVYWVAVAGYDPAALLRRAEGRIPAVHFKDLEVIGWEPPTYAPVGEGNLDWDAIVAACRIGGSEWLIVEQDTCRRDPFDCLASSYRFVSNLIGAGSSL